MNSLQGALNQRVSPAWAHLSVLIADKQAHSSLLGAERQGVQTMSVSTVGGGAEDIIERLQTFHYDVVVLDPMMGGKVPPAAFLDAVLRTTRSGVVAYSAIDTVAVASLVISRGVLGFVSRKSCMETLFSAIDHAAKGRVFVDSSVALVASKRHPWLLLTASERLVAEALFRGKAMKRIALDTERHYNTVHALRAKVLEKLGLRTDSDLLHYIYQNGLVHYLES